MPWLADHGFNLPGFAASDGLGISAFAWIDVVITAIVVLVFIAVENQRSPVNQVWLPVAGTLLVGPPLVCRSFCGCERVNRSRALRQ